MSAPTWKMSETQLARAWAEHHGITGGKGGYLRTPDGLAVCQGWDVLARYLAERGVIAVGSGINWRRADLAGITPRRVRAAVSPAALAAARSGR